MKPTTKLLCTGLLLLGGVLPAKALEPRKFLDQYCIECHGAEKQKADRRYDQLTLPATNLEGVIALQDIVDQLNLGEMPPSKAKQPTTAERLEIVDRLTEAVTAGRAQFSGHSEHTVLRRLNRREYRNTVGDLFALDMRLFDPTSKFPRDEMVAHMDNQGDVLKTSGYLLAAYLDAADEVVERALAITERPKEQLWTFKDHFSFVQEANNFKKTVSRSFIGIYEGPHSDKNEGSHGWVKEFENGVPCTGIYEIKVKAEALNRVNPHPRELFDRVVEEPFRLGIVPGDVNAGPLYRAQSIEPRLAETIVRDGEPQYYTLRVSLAAGQTPRFIFPNGPISFRKAAHKIGLQVLRQNGFTGTPKAVQLTQAGIGDQSFFPHIRIHEVQIRGPIVTEWPSATLRSVLDNQPFSAERTREILKRFADRAYRRPVQPEELEHLVHVVEARRKTGRTAFEALKDGLKAILCSPSFLYHPSSSHDSPASPAQVLASRMSYFLTASMPDAELRKLADSGELLKPEVRLAQMRRLLAGKGGVFVEGFLDSWLNLRSLGDMPPDRGSFQVYYSSDLQAAMKRETQLFAWDLLSQNKSVTHFLDSDYTFVNQPLATLYGLGEIAPPEAAHEFRKVTLTDHRRGGLLGQGSILTVSANGVETSPVTRGVWVLENILGTPPSPPPDNVPPIDPDVRGSKNIRDLLVKHRENATCFQCHQKIDPPGFALENFDPIGAWRTNYKEGRKTGPKIDPAGEMPGGKTFTDIVGLKQILVSRKNQFAQMLTERLLTYACGRRMTGTDRPQVEEILQKAASSDFGFRSLIEAVILSDTFAGN